MFVPPVLVVPPVAVDVPVDVVVLLDGLDAIPLGRRRFPSHELSVRLPHHALIGRPGSGKGIRVYHATTS